MTRPFEMTAAARCLLATGLLLGSAQRAAAASEVNPSILVMYADDLAGCPAQVRQARTLLPGSVINFVPHLFSRNDDAGRLVSLCQRFDRYAVCGPITEAYLRRWQRGWERCFAAAVDLGLDIAVLPHLDGAEATSQWRNTIAFDPLASYGSLDPGAPGPRYSYRDAMLEPLVRALERTVTPETGVHFALQGEMGRTLFDHPEACLTLVEAVRRRLAPIARAEVGVSVNFNKLNGTTEMLWFEPDETGHARSSAMRRLLDGIDFLGVSAYHWMHRRPTVDDVREGVRQFVMEWSYRDLPLPEGLPLAFSEFGVGGGWRENDGARPARSRLEAALYPWAGIYGPYVVAADPWQDPDLRAYRREFFVALLAYLAARSSSHPVEAAFLWNVGSWDVLGLFPGMKRYRDEGIVERLGPSTIAAWRRDDEPAASLKPCGRFWL